MYSKEQIYTRLKLGSTLTTAELALVVKAMYESIEKLQEEVNILKEINNEQLSKDRRTTNIDSGKTIQTTPIQSGFKL